LRLVAAKQKLFDTQDVSHWVKAGLFTDKPFSGRLLKTFGFAERIRGDHHIFTKQDVEEILNRQPKGSKAKPYQVKQVHRIMLRYKLTLE
jgi:hypothetical protein